MLTEQMLPWQLASVIEGTRNLQGVSKKSTHFGFAHFSASKTSWKVVLYIFQQLSLCRIKRYQYFYSGIRIGKFIDKICSENIMFVMVSIEVSNKFDATFCFYISRLLRHLKKWFCTVFNSLTIAESKNIKIYILDLKLANALTKVWGGITFVEIECNLVIMWYKVTLLYINPPILILE